MKNAGHTAAATADQPLKYDSCKCSKMMITGIFSFWSQSKSAIVLIHGKHRRCGLSFVSFLRMWIVLVQLPNSSFNRKIKSFNNYARISKTLERVQLRIRFKATIINAAKTRRWKWLVEIPHCCSKCNRKSGAVGCEAAVTHVSCTFCSNALLAGRVMGPPKKMKLGANKVRGANCRLMLTARSGKD